MQVLSLEILTIFYLNSEIVMLFVEKLKINFRQDYTKGEINMSTLKTLVLGSFVVGSNKNKDFRMGILQTSAGTFSTTSNENPEMVDTIAKLRDGDSIEVEMHGPFAAFKRSTPDGEAIDVSCNKFRLLSVEAGHEPVIKGLEGRSAKATVRKNETVSPSAALPNASVEDEDRG